LERPALDFESLRILDRIARLGSFSAAAEELNYTPSGVSRRVAALERAAGGALFERGARGVRLTPAGSALQRHAEAMLARVAEAQAELEAIRSGSGGQVRLGAFPTAGASLVPVALREFQARRPQVSVAFVEGLTPDLIERVGSGEIDVAVVSDYLTGIDDDTVELVHLIDEPLLLAVPAEHRLARANQVQLRDLACEDWIQGRDHPSDSALAIACAAAGFTPRVRLKVRDWTAKLGFVAAGFGLALIPGLAARAVRSDLIVRAFSHEPPTRRIYAALPTQVAPLAAARELAALLRSAADRHRDALLERTSG
jgi:DNA-binding transcriptional LysR family regulator